MADKKETRNITLEARQWDYLEALSKGTSVSMSAYVRAGVELLLVAHKIKPEVDEDLRHLTVPR